MADPFRQIRPGEVVTNWPRQPWNQMVGRLKNQADDGPTGSPTGGPITILLENTTGVPVDEFSILGIGRPVTTFAENESIFKDQDVDQGIAPEAGKPFAVLQRPIAVDGFGPARILGRTPVYLNLTDITHEFAAPSDSTDQLDSAASGPARILWVETDDESGGRATGEQWAVVILQGTAPDTEVLVVLTDADTETYADSGWIVYEAYRVTEAAGEDGGIEYTLGELLTDNLLHLNKGKLPVWPDFHGSGSGSGSGGSSGYPVPAVCVHWIRQAPSGQWVFDAPAPVGLFYLDTPVETVSDGVNTLRKGHAIVFNQKKKMLQKMEIAADLDLSLVPLYTPP